MCQEARQGPEDSTLEYSSTEKFQNNAGELLFSEYLSAWLKSRQSEISKATFDSYALMLNNQIVPYYQKRNIYLFELRPKDIADYHQMLSDKGVSPNTVIRHHAVLHKALEDAVYRELIPYNPADRIRRPKKKEYIAKPYTDEECRQLLEAIQGEKLELAIMLALYTGMRRGELLGLRWGAVDFTENLIHINHAIVRGVEEKGRVIIGQDKLKREASFRTLPMVDPVRAKLLEVAKCRYGLHTPPAQDYILVDKSGKVLKPDYLSEAFPKLLIKHGLRQIRLHDLRHSCANLLITARTPLIEVQQWLGHSSIVTTADIYSHLAYETKLNSAETIKNFNEEKDVMMNKNEKMTVKEWVAGFSSETTKAVKDFLDTGCLKLLICTDNNSFYAEFEEYGDIQFAEVILDAHGQIEDMDCNCNKGLCIHLATMLWQLNNGEAINGESIEI